MGDPVGPPAIAETLAWRFRELCDRHGGRPVFYQVDAERLPLYLDLGLSPLKIGEAAVVDLGGFSLVGSARADLRQAQRKLANSEADHDRSHRYCLDPAGLFAVWITRIAMRSHRDYGVLGDLTTRCLGGVVGALLGATISRSTCVRRRKSWPCTKS